jgi:hypothetical protein
VRRSTPLLHGSPAWLGNAALLLFGLLLTSLLLAAAEGLLRASDPTYLVRTRGLHVASDVYGWRLRPGVATRAGGVRVTVNAHG